MNSSRHSSTLNRQTDYRHIVSEEGTITATKLFNNTSKSKQQLHKSFMKTSFIAQTRGDFCGLASIASTLHHLNQLTQLNVENFENITNQQHLYNNYVKSCLDVRYGISMIQLVQIIAAIISDFDLPYHVSYVCLNDYDKLTKIFQRDIVFLDQFFEAKKTFMIIANFWRKIDNHRGGHWSPIVNISSDKQSIFIADVASHRLKPHWIKISEFIPLMCHQVKSTKLPRGYIRIFNIAELQNPYNKLAINQNVYVRIATNQDILTLSKIQVSAWKQTYRGIIDDKWLDSQSMTVQKKYGHWTRIFNDNYCIQRQYEPSRKYAVYKYVLVVCERNRVLGYCAVGEPGRSSMKKMFPALQPHGDDIININGELYTLYLDGRCPRRQGFGGTLFDVGYGLIQHGFNWNAMVESRITQEIKMDQDCKKCVMALWLLGDNQIALKFYHKKGGIMVNENESARFGKKRYRYCSMVFGLKT